MCVQPSTAVRARCYFRTIIWTVRGYYLNAGVCRRFLCFCFFVAVGKRNEVPPRTVANDTKQESPTSNSLKPQAVPPNIKLARTKAKPPNIELAQAHAE